VCTGRHYDPGARAALPPPDAPVADPWGLIAAQAKKEGAVLPVIDGLLAATALHHNLTVVSRNTAS